MTIIRSQPLGPTGTKLTEEIYDKAQELWRQEGGHLADILETKFNVLDFNPYEHYYGYNIPID